MISMTNKLTQEIHMRMCPKAALIAYACEKGDNYFLEMRAINKNGRMSEGRPVTVDFMNELVKNYSEIQSDTPRGRIPKNLLYCDTRKGSEKYIWYNPPRKRMMYFVEKLNMENSEYYIPGIIYEAGEHGMNIYAYVDNILTENSQLYRAPFFNVSGASVCLGLAKIERPSSPTYESILEYWEKKFWLTEFSHLGGEGNPTKSNLVLVTKAAKDRSFDTNQLKSFENMKLKDLLL